MDAAFHPDHSGLGTVFRSQFGQDVFRTWPFTVSSLTDLQPSPTSDLPAERHYCRKTCRPLRSQQRAKRCVLKIC